MKLLLQRVKSASVSVDNRPISTIGKGLLIYLGIGRHDSSQERDFLIRKLLSVRLFPNGSGQLDLSVQDTKGDILVVSQFTLYGDCMKGRRPSFDRAASVEHARRMYHDFCDHLRSQYSAVSEGVFQANMSVESVNDGPFTLLLDKDAAPI